MSASVLGGFWNANGVTTLATIHTRSWGRRLAAWALSKKQNMALRELMETLDGTAAGSTASKTLSRIVASSELGGVRAIETETLVNRATVAGDVTDINTDILTHNSYDSTPVANGDGNPLGGSH